MDAIITFLIVFSAIMIFFGVVYLHIKNKEHKVTRDRRIAACKALSLSQAHTELFVDLANRTYVFYYSFAMQNIIAILCDLFSFVFSVATFVNIANEELNVVVSLLAIIFVIIAIYIKPRRRSSQYLKSWREMEYMTLQTLHKMTQIVDPQMAGMDKMNKIFEDVNNRRAKIEGDISTDEE